MRLTINRMMPNGAINAIAEYGEGDWCILVFPSMTAVEKFAAENSMGLGFTAEVQAQMEAARGPGAPG